MKKIILNIIIFFIICIKYAVADVVLQTGSICRDCQGFTIGQKNKIWDMEDVAAEKNITSIDSIIAYITLEDNETDFVLERDLLLAQINTTNKTISGPWALTRWPHLHYSPEKLSVYHEIAANSDYPYGKPQYSPYAKVIGCLHKQPLRYGSLYTSEPNEIVLFLNRQLIVFSPQYQRIVFAEIFDNSDWLSAATTTKIVTENGKNEMAQFGSSLIADNAHNAIQPGMRTYSKLYIGDFNNNQLTDIIVWRKTYTTHLRDNPVAGFSLKRNDFQHYERNLTVQATLPEGVTGEYLPQTTDETTVKGWLASNTLTWQKGYPSLSECAGQEGQLIPEMHDSFLNDPEMLQ